MLPSPANSEMGMQLKRSGVTMPNLTRLPWAPLRLLRVHWLPAPLGPRLFAGGLWFGDGLAGWRSCGGLLSGSILLALALSQPLAVAAQPASVPTSPAPAGAPASSADPSLGSQAVTYSGTVLKLENGQVLVVRIGGRERRVRLACVQAPRAVQEPWAAQAREALQRRVPLGSQVEIGLRARDVFARLVAVVRLNGRDVAPSLLRQGALFAYDGYLGQCADLGYPRIEREARQLRLGIWSVEGGIERPWDVMARQRNALEEP